MTTFMITLLILGGAALVVAIGFLSNAVENAKIERERSRRELTDRLRRCGEISEVFPGQFMTPALKLLLTRLELNLTQRLALLEKRSLALKERIAELQADIEKGPDIPVNNPPASIETEERAKEVRHLLEGLHAQVSRGAKDECLHAGEAKHWIKEIRHILVLLHIEFFINLGQQELRNNQHGQARLAFERGVNYLKTLAEPAPYQADLENLQQLLASTNSVVLTNIAKASNEASELNQGLQEEAEKDIEDGVALRPAMYD